MFLGMTPAESYVYCSSDIFIVISFEFMVLSIASRPLLSDVFNNPGRFFDMPPLVL